VSWLANKRTSLQIAIENVHDGDLVGLGGMSLYRRPVAGVLELIRQGRRELRLLDYIGGFEGDILIGSGCVAEVRSCYFGMDVLGLAPMHRRAVGEGRLGVVQETEMTVAVGLRATRSGVDFIPARIFAETDMAQIRTDLEHVDSPYSGVSYVAIPAIEPDVAIIHALLADEAGNTILGGEYNLDQDLAAAARRTIVTAERIVDTEVIEEHGADIPGAWVDHVVEASSGARPTSCYPEYEVDLEFLADYVEACGDGQFEAFLDERLLQREPA